MNENISAQKKFLRKKIILQRKNLSIEKRKFFSQKIVKKFLATEIYKNSSAIMAYIPMTEEVQLQEFFFDAFDRKKICAIPFTVEKGIMKPVIFENFDSLEVGEFKILTVKKDFRKFIDEKIFDCVIVPGVAFDVCGKRLGMGGGYYDRFLKLAENAKKISLAFDFQILENIPTEPHDIPVDLILTEKREICTKIF